MDKKGMAWETLAIIIVLIVSFVVIFGWSLLFGSHIKEEGKSAGCSLSIIQASSFIGSTKSQITGKDLPSLSCPKIPVEIKSDKEDEIIEELSDYIYKVAKEFSKVGFVRVYEGRYCRRRYHPINFVSSLDAISKEKLNSYIQKNP